MGGDLVVPECKMVVIIPERRTAQGCRRTLPGNVSRNDPFRPRVAGSLQTT